MAKKILITGWLGYIGSHAAILFAEAGYQVILVDNLSNASLTVFGEIEEISGNDSMQFYELDINDPLGLEQVFDEHRDIDAVIHCARIRSFGESNEDPFLYYNTNVGGTINLCSLMRKYKIKKIVHISSAALYSSQKIAPPFTETDPYLLTNSFMTTTYMVENMLRDMAACHGFFFAAALRVTNVIGAHHSGLLGNKPSLTPSDLIGSMYTAALHGQPRLTVFGNDYKTIDGTCVRDYIHVMDVARALLLSYQYLSDLLGKDEDTNAPDRGFFDLFNVGAGKGKSILEMIALVEKVTGVKIPYVVSKRRKGDDPTNVVSVDKIYHTLSWEPELTTYRAISDGWRYVTSL